MKQMNFENIKTELEKVKKVRGVVLVERDIELLELILDMKFVSVQDVFEKFFKVTKSGEIAKSNEWAIRRLQQLEKSGYLKGAYSFSERTKFYLATMKAYHAVAKAKPEEIVLKPSQVIDHRTFDHDRYVLESRIMLENMRAATCWISDKKLRSSTELAGGLTFGNVPDGIYKNENGEKVAFELELSKKSHKVYLAKIKKYVTMMRSKSEQGSVFNKVIYVCAKQYVYDLLVKETKIYGELFEVQKLSIFFKRDESATLSPSKS